MEGLVSGLFSGPLSNHAGLTELPADLPQRSPGRHGSSLSSARYAVLAAYRIYRALKKGGSGLRLPMPTAPSVDGSFSRQLQLFAWLCSSLSMAIMAASVCGSFTGLCRCTSWAEQLRAAILSTLLVNATVPLARIVSSNMSWILCRLVAGGCVKWTRPAEGPVAALPRCLLTLLLIRSRTPFSRAHGCDVLFYNA